MLPILSKNKLLIFFFILTNCSFPQLKSENTFTEKPAAKHFEPSSYKFILMLSGGIGIPVGYEEQYKNGFAVNLGYIPYSDGYHGLRLEADYLHLKHKDNPLETGGDLTIYNLRLDILGGYLKPKSAINAYAIMSLGFSVGHFSEKQTITTRYDYYSKSFVTETHYAESMDGFALRTGVGVGLNSNLTGNIRLFTELQYDYWTFGLPIGEGEIFSKAGIMIVDF